MNREKAIKLAKKLKALSERGVEGERRSAKQKFEAIIDKYGLMPDEIGDTIKVFERTTLNEGSVILDHIIKSVVPDAKIFVKQIKSKLIIECEMSDIEYREVNQKYRCFWKNYNKGRKLYLSAFVNKNFHHLKPAKKHESKYGGFDVGKASQEPQDMPPPPQQEEQPTITTESSDGNNSSGQPKKRDLTREETIKVRKMMEALDETDYKSILNALDSDNNQNKDNDYAAI